MKPADIITLIQKGVRQGETWADLGSGDGAFTLALRELLGAHADVYSIDVDASKLARQERVFRAGPGVARTTFVRADFTQPLELPPLDGMLMANALHFVEDQLACLRGLSRYLRSPGKLLIVEYDITQRSRYVPHPVSFNGLTVLAQAAGFDAPALIGTTRSRYWSRIYAATILVGAST